MLKSPKIYPYLLIFGLNFGLISTAFSQTSALPISPSLSSPQNIIQPTLPPPAQDTQEYALSGRWLYCVSRGSGTNTQTDLVLSTIDGTQSKVLYSVRGRIFAFNSSFNPRYVTFATSSYNGFPLAYRLDLQTSHIQLLTPYKANNLGASISPDGNSFLFSSDMDGNLELYYTSFAKNNLAKPPTRLTNEPNADISPSWSPDGQSFIFVSDRQAYMYPQVYRYDFATGDITPIDTHSDYATEAKFNPTGDKITLLNRTQGAVFDLHTGQKKSVNDEGLDEAPTFSPDGQFIAYSTGKAIVVVPEHRIWEKEKLSDSDKIVVIPTLPKNVTGTIRRLIWIS